MQNSVQQRIMMRLARQRARKLRTHEALAELERAQKLSLQSDKARGHHLNDDKSPLIDLMNCIVCRETMKIEKSAPDAEGKNIIHYRCAPHDTIHRRPLLPPTPNHPPSR